MISAKRKGPHRLFYFIRLGLNVALTHQIRLYHDSETKEKKTIKVPASIVCKIINTNKPPITTVTEIQCPHGHNKDR